MNDAEQMFRQTEIERKRLSYGDKHKKRGGGRYVRLPSDNLTRKEREAMNGEIKVWQEKPFYTFEEFKELPDDVQLKWINSLINRYDVGIGGISRIIAPSANRNILHDYMERKGLLEYVNAGGRGGAAAKGAGKLRSDYDAYMAKPKEIEQDADPAIRIEWLGEQKMGGCKMTIRQYSDAQRALGVLEGLSEGMSTTAQAALLRNVKTLADLIEAMFQEAE